MRIHLLLADVNCELFSWMVDICNSEADLSALHLLLVRNRHSLSCIFLLQHVSDTGRPQLSIVKVQYVHFLIILLDHSNSAEQNFINTLYERSS